MTRGSIYSGPLRAVIPYCCCMLSAMSRNCKLLHHKITTLKEATMGPVCSWLFLPASVCFCARQFLSSECKTSWAPFLCSLKCCERPLNHHPLLDICGREVVHLLKAMALSAPTGWVVQMVITPDQSMEKCKCANLAKVISKQRIKIHKDLYTLKEREVRENSRY